MINFKFEYLLLLNYVLLLREHNIYSVFNSSYIANNYTSDIDCTETILVYDILY